MPPKALSHDQQWYAALYEQQEMILSVLKEIRKLLANRQPQEKAPAKKGK